MGSSGLVFAGEFGSSSLVMVTDGVWRESVLECVERRIMGGEVLATLLIT